MIIKSTDWSKTLHKIGDHYNDFWFYTIKLFVDIDRDIHKVKLKNALNEKRKKLRGFSFSINMANFEAFRRTKKLISNLFFLKSVYPHFQSCRVNTADSSNMHWELFSRL